MGLGHNDPWVESHIRPQKMWGQRSSRGQWPLFQFFCKNCHCIHILDVCSGETRGSRTTCLLVGVGGGWFPYVVKNQPKSHQTLISIFEPELIPPRSATVDSFPKIWKNKTILLHLFQQPSQLWVYRVRFWIQWTKKKSPHLSSIIPIRGPQTVPEMSPPPPKSLEENHLHTFCVNLFWNWRVIKLLVRFSRIIWNTI